jgi:hypothetical protein
MRILLTVALALVTAQPLRAEQTVDNDTGQLDATIQHLISTVANSDLVFVRNDNHYDGARAAAHILRKYEHFKEQISTPERFIDLCASRSLLSGKPYQVILASGERVALADWLLLALQQYRERQAPSQQSQP